MFVPFTTMRLFVLAEGISPTVEEPQFLSNQKPLKTVISLFVFISLHGLAFVDSCQSYT